MHRGLMVVGLAAATVLTGAAGWIDARLTNRWSTPDDLQVAAKQLSGVPTHVGDWQMQTDTPLSPDVEKMLQCSGNFNRRYVNSTTHEVVDVAAIVGPPGPTAAHTPEICYTSRDHIPLDEPTPVSIRPQEREDEDFWRMTFQANDLEGARLRVYYAWSDASGNWKAAKYPRIKYGGQPLLYKIQVAAHWPKSQESDASKGLDNSQESEDSDACQRFLESFLPALDQALFQ